MSERKAKLNRAHALPISRQCLALDIARSSAYRFPAEVNEAELELMRQMGIRALHPGAKTTRPNTSHKVYPYLLRNLEIKKVNQVWCTDITYIPMQKGFLYLVAIMDWYSRKVLSWRLSNSLDTAPCLEALEEALLKHGSPDIFNSDDFTRELKSKEIKISMDGKGRWIDNVFRLRA